MSRATTRHPPELRERARRLVREHRDERPSEWAALQLALLNEASATAVGRLVEHLGGRPAIIRRALKDRLQRAYAEGA